tara:strand:+ start:1661 stop:1837 length:177 start_codon:yes stop_codon:yes gene_type:complete
MTVMYNPEGTQWDGDDDSFQWGWNIKNELEDQDWLDSQRSNHLFFEANQDGKQATKSG